MKRACRFISTAVRLKDCQPPRLHSNLLPARFVSAALKPPLSLKMCFITPTESCSVEKTLLDTKMLQRRQRSPLLIDAIHL